jgi:hypothetical protein
MKVRYLLEGMIFILLTCTTCTTENDVPDNNLISDIIKETIKQDSLDTSLSLSNQLINYYLYTPNKNSSNKLPEVLPPRNEKGDLFAFNFIRVNLKSSIGYFVTHEDSLYFANQINRNKNITLDSIRFSDIIRVKNVSYLNVNVSKHKKMYFFSIPILNHEKTIAWVTYDYYCNACGYGRLVILKKVNKKWLKTTSYTTWRN